MNTAQTIRVIFETIAGLAIIWAVFNEDKFIQLEDWIAERWRRL